MDNCLFRTAVGNFATEVEGGGHGITANAFMSVSLDPKLVGISVRDQARILSKFKKPSYLPCEGSWVF